MTAFAEGLLFSAVIRHSNTYSQLSHSFVIFFSELTLSNLLPIQIWDLVWTFQSPCCHTLWNKRKICTEYRRITMWRQSPFRWKDGELHVIAEGTPSTSPIPSSPGTNLPSWPTPTYNLALIVSMCSACVASVPGKKPSNSLTCEQCPQALFTHFSFSKLCQITELNVFEDWSGASPPPSKRTGVEVCWGPGCDNKTTNFQPCLVLLLHTTICSIHQFCSSVHCRVALVLCGSVRGADFGAMSRCAHLSRAFPWVRWGQLLSAEKEDWSLHCSSAQKAEQRKIVGLQMRASK